MLGHDHDPERSIGNHLGQFQHPRIMQLGNGSERRTLIGLLRDNNAMGFRRRMSRYNLTYLEWRVIGLAAQQASRDAARR